MAGKDKARNKGCKLVLPYPPTTNNLYATIMVRGKPIRVPTTEAKRYRMAVQSAANLAGVDMLVGPVAMTYMVYRPRKSGDLSNTFKAIEDALIGIAYKDDGQVEKIVAQRYEDKDNPRVEVWVDPVIY